MSEFLDLQGEDIPSGAEQIRCVSSLKGSNPFDILSVHYDIISNSTEATTESGIEAKD